MTWIIPRRVRSAHPGPWGSKGVIAVPIDDVRLRVRLTGHDLSLQRGIGREHAMKANGMRPGTWDDGREALQEFQRGHDEMGGAIAVRGFQLQHDLTGPGAAELFVAEGRTCDVATEAFEILSLMGTTPGIGMQAKPLGTDTALWVQRLLASHNLKVVGSKHAPATNIQ